MSGSSWMTLSDTPPAAASALPSGTDLPRLHAAITADIVQALGPAHAMLFATPVPTDRGVSWRVQGTDARRLSDLPADSRRDLLAAAGSIRSDLRRLVESGRAPALASAWPAVCLVPSLASVFAVDGRPVLADWSHAPAAGGDTLAAYDDRVGFKPKQPARWQPWAAAAASVVLLALLAVLLLPQLARWAVAEPAMCRLEPAQLGLMRQQAAAEARGHALQALLAATNDDIGRKQLLCPLQVAQALPASPPQAPRTPPPPPAPRSLAPRAELPSDAWNRHDLAMLEGCWHSSTRMETRDLATDRVHAVEEWRLCFDRNGRGHQSIRWTDQSVCTGPQSANFLQDDQLLLQDTARCGASGRNLRRGTFTCRRINDTEATCVRTDVEGPAIGRGQTGRFSR